MPIRGSYVVRVPPAGLVDSADQGEAFPGASTILQNLIFDPKNPGCVISRPGVYAAITQAQFNTMLGSGTATFISHHVAVGTRLCGWVSASGGTYGGKDVPFVYESATPAFISLTGLVAADLPTSPSTTGAWTPPTIAVVGDYVVFTHPGFSGAVGKFFGTVKISTGAWQVRNTAVNLLPSVPSAVANYNNRAYFACGNQSWYSDSLDPNTMTNAGQSLTHGDNTSITAYSGNPVQTQSGGVVGQLLIFKGTQIWYITGDAAITGTLSTNFLSLTMGTLYPRTVCWTAEGTHFVGTDGACIIDAFGTIRPLAYESGKKADIRIPFLNATTPSRACAAYTQNVYRVCLQTNIGAGVVTNDYWFDKSRQRWNGPHTFAYDCATQYGILFILTSAAKGAVVYVSSTLFNPDGVFTDADDLDPPAVHWQSATWENKQNMCACQIVESVQELLFGSTPANYRATMLNGVLGVINSVSINIPAYSTAITSPVIANVPWEYPLVSTKFAFDFTCLPLTWVMVGEHRSRQVDLAYAGTEFYVGPAGRDQWGTTTGFLPSPGGGEEPTSHAPPTSPVPIPQSPLVPVRNDSEWSKVLLLCDFDYNIEDLSSYQRPLTVQYDGIDATPTIVNSNYRFPNGGLKSYNRGGPPYNAVYTAVSSDFGFSGDFTIEGWFKQVQLVQSFGFYLYCDANNYITLYYEYPPGRWVITSEINGPTHVLVGFQTAGLGRGGWDHIAVVRYNGTLTYYVNGYAITSSATLTGTLPSGQFIIANGNYGGNLASCINPFGGYIDEIRVTLGARYKSNFRVPVSAFPLGPVPPAAIHCVFTTIGGTLQNWGFDYGTEDAFTALEFKPDGSVVWHGGTNSSSPVRFNWAYPLAQSAGTYPGDMFWIKFTVLAKDSFCFLGTPRPVPDPDPGWIPMRNTIFVGVDAASHHPIHPSPDNQWTMSLTVTIQIATDSNGSNIVCTSTPWVFNSSVTVGEVTGGWF